jgi:diguanylate cyclase (GGDEF)-like protein
MERSRKGMPMSQRSKGACTIAALAVGFGCAVFGVGGADGGTRAYARHLREARLEARLAGVELSHRSPEQLLLAIRPKAHAAATPTAVTQAPIATSVTTSAATTSTAPAATTTTTTSTTPSTTTSSTASAAESASESAAPSNPVNTATTSTTGTTTTGTTTTGTTTTGTTTSGTTTTGTGTTTTGTTTTGTTTTGTTTTGTTTTGTTTTGTTTPTGTATTTGTTTTGTTTTGTTTGTANASTGENGRVPGTTTTDTTSTACHGRCETNTGTSAALPASLPSTSSSNTSSNFPLTVTSVPAVTPAASTAVNDASSATLNLTPTTPATSSTTPTPTPSGNVSNSLSDVITQLEHKFSTTSSIGHLTQSSGSHHSGAALPTTAAGTGAVPAGGGTGTGPAGTTGTGTGAGTTAAGHRSALAHRRDRHPSSGGTSAFTAPFSSGARVIDNVVKVIPTAVWIALGAAFALMLAFAGIAFQSSRRARRREKDFAAISAAALTDALTGVLNRRGFTEAAERELARASRYHRPFVLAYVDVRGLKTVNDTEGHLMGDELIKTVADLMKESARADDVVGRIGGDEFALLLGEQTAESAEPVVRRIRARVAEARAAMEISVPWELTIGMASFPDDGATLDELLDLADRRLYEQRGIALR